MRSRSPQRASRDGGRPLSELLAWHGLESGGWLRGANGSLSATLEIRDPRPGAALAALAAKAAARLGAGWRVLAEIQRLPAAGGVRPAPSRAYLTLTREPTAAPATRRAAVGRRRRRHAVIDADLQHQGEVEVRLDAVRQLAAGPRALRRLDGRRLAAYLHATLTGAGHGCVAGLDLLLTAGRLHRDGGLRLEDTWIVPVAITAAPESMDGALLTLIDQDHGPLRAVLRHGGRRGTTTRPATGSLLTVHDLLALPGGAPSGAARRSSPPAAILLTYDTRRRRAARRAAALVDRLRDAGCAAGVADADPAAAFLSSLPADTPRHEHGAPSIRMQPQRDPDDPTAPGGQS